MSKKLKFADTNPPISPKECESVTLSSDTVDYRSLLMSSLSVSEEGPWESFVRPPSDANRSSLAMTSEIIGDVGPYVFRRLQDRFQELYKEVERRLDPNVAKLMLLNPIVAKSMLLNDPVQVTRCFSFSFPDELSPAVESTLQKNKEYADTSKPVKQWLM